MRRAAAVILAVVTSLASTSITLAGGGRPAPAALPSAAPKTSAVPPGEHATDRVIVAWRDSERARGGPLSSDLGEIAQLGPHRQAGEARAWLMSTNGRKVDEVLASLRADPDVAYAEPDYKISLVPDGDSGGAQVIPVNDPGTGGQYALDRMAVRDAWGLGTGGGRLVAVLDTGVSYVHPDLSGRVAAGYDFRNEDSDARDDHGHGTWVAGIIAANANDSYGIAGISWSDKILPVKILNETGTGYTSDLIEGIYYAADQGASVINMSVGGYSYSQAARVAIDYAWSKGAVLLAAAGNNRREETYYPASYPNVVSVSATQADDEFTNWSSYGPAVDVSAPGGSIYTTDCDGCSTSSPGGATWVKISGTSFATPNAAGVVALIRGRNPTWTNQQVVDRLLATVDDLGYPGWDNRYGHGRVNAFRALGGSPTSIALSSGDGFEANNTLAAARPIVFGDTIRPSIHPASDVDLFWVDIPRAGQLTVKVTAVVDSYRLPKSSLPVDPVVEILSLDGSLILKVDHPTNPAATEQAVVEHQGARRVLIRVSNWYPNGSKDAYSLVASFVDNVMPSVVAQNPGPGAAGVASTIQPSLTFNEPVSGVDAERLELRDASGARVAGTVSYDPAALRAVFAPALELLGETEYTLVLGSGVTDAGANAVPPGTWKFITGRAYTRLAGADRYATAAAVSAWHFAPGVPVAYVATGAGFPDALAGAPAAAAAGGPLLLVTADAIPAVSAAELSRLRPGRIVVLGGPGVVSPTVEAGLAAYTAGGVSRLAGADRYATAAAVSAAHFAPGVALAYVATGANYPDALAGAAAAARVGAPVLLVQSQAIPAATAAELSRLRPGRIVVLGGPGVVSPAVESGLAAYTAGGVSRLAGADRYATAVAVSGAGFGPDEPALVFVATGAAFPDGLAVAGVAGRSGAPLLLVRPDALPAVVAAELRRLNPSTVVVLGSTGAVSAGVVSAIRALWP